MAADEIDGVTMREDRTDGLRKMLVEQVGSTPSRGRKRRRRIALTAGGLGIFLIGGTALAATAIHSAQSISNTDIVHCLTSTELNSDGSLSGSAATLANASGTGSRVDDALAICGDMWRQGVLGSSQYPLAASDDNGVVPGNLQVCVLGDGSAAVVPGNADACASMGFSPLKR